MDENCPLDVTSSPQQQGPLANEYSKVTTPVLGQRSPFKDIANNPSEARTVKKEKTRAVFARHEVDSKLDEDERSWRDRTEVITRIDHDAYQMFAKEVINDAVNKVEEESVKIKMTVIKPVHRGVAKFRETLTASLGDSVPSDEQEPIEDELFGSPLYYPIFNNPEDLDVLGSHGTEGDKLNLVRNSLYVKFDPLVSGRQSLAPFLAQHLKESNNEVVDPRRTSGLISFSPSPTKRQRCTDHAGTPVKALFVSVADETLVLDATSLENTTVNDGGNTTVVASNQTVNNSTISTTLIDANETLIHLPVINIEKMYSERELKDKLKNMELIMQDSMFRKSREFEDIQKRLNRELTEQNIAMAGMEEENVMLRLSIKQMQDVMAKIVQQEAIKEKEHKNQLILLENQYELQLTALRKECEQCKDDLKKAEVPLFDLVKKFERLREVSEKLWKNEEALKSKNESLESKLIQKEETFKTIIKHFEEKYNKAQEEYLAKMHSHDQELKKASLMLRKAELKILTLTETVEKASTENSRLKDLIDDISRSMGGN